MRTVSRIIVAACMLAGAVIAHAQNWATVTASNITDLNQNKLAAGQLCFLVTDQNDTPISVGVGGGGQTLKRPFCSPVAGGAVTAFTVPNPASTQPAGIYYRITVKDTSTGQEVLRYTQVTFAGGSFNFDAYAPTNLGSFAPLTGNSVSGNLSVSGNASVTGTLGATGGMKNTSLTAAGNGNSVTLLNQQPAGSPMQGTGGDVTVYTYTIPPNTVGAGKCIRIKWIWYHNSGTALVTYKLNIGSTAFGVNGSTGVDNLVMENYGFTICNNSGVQNAQNFQRYHAFRSSNVTGVYLNEIIENQGTSAVDFTQAQTITAAFNVASSDQVTPKFWLVELIQ